MIGTYFDMRPTPCTVQPVNIPWLTRSRWSFTHFINDRSGKWKVQGKQASVRSRFCPRSWTKCHDMWSWQPVFPVAASGSALVRLYNRENPLHTLHQRPSTITSLSPRAYFSSLPTRSQSAQHEMSGIGDRDSQTTGLSVYEHAKVPS